MSLPIRSFKSPSKAAVHFNSIKSNKIPKKEGILWLATAWWMSALAQIPFFVRSLQSIQIFPYLQFILSHQQLIHNSHDFWRIFYWNTNSLQWRFFAQDISNNSGIPFLTLCPLSCVFALSRSTTSLRCLSNRPFRKLQWIKERIT